MRHIYEDYNEADKSISNNLEKICDEEIGKYEQQVTTSRQDVKPENKEKMNLQIFYKMVLIQKEKLLKMIYIM